MKELESDIKSDIIHDIQSDLDNCPTHISFKETHLIIGLTLHTFNISTDIDVVEALIDEIESYQDNRDRIKFIKDVVVRMKFLTRVLQKKFKEAHE